MHVVFGASGPLGSAVIRELVARGKPARAVTRSGTGTAPEGVEVVRGDATDRDSVLPACRGAAVVYHCACAPYTDWPAQLPPIMHGIIEGASSARAKLVFGDNLYMYGPVTGPITEDLPYDAQGPKGRTRATMAETLLEAHGAGKVRATIGRGSDFFGPRVTKSHMGERVFWPALNDRAVSMLGKLDVAHTYTFIDDFARGLVTLGERDEALGQAWHIPSAETITTRAFVKLVFDEVGANPGISVARRPIISLLAAFNPMMRELKETLYQLELPFVVDHSKYEQAFGAHTTPHREAIRKALEWFRSNPPTSA